MSFIDDLKNKALGDNPTLGALVQMIGNQPGGFSGLAQAFHEKGLGEVVNSWVGTGANQSITADQIQSVLGNEHIKEFAAKAGIPPEQASAKIAEFLPQVVDKLTPNGQLPKGNLVEAGKELLKGLGGKVA